MLETPAAPNPFSGAPAAGCWDVGGWVALLHPPTAGTPTMAIVLPDRTITTDIVVVPGT